MNTLGDVRKLVSRLPATAQTLQAVERTLQAAEELIAADSEYDAARDALKDLSRHIGERGWVDVEYDALRQASARFGRAFARRQCALDAFTGDPA